MLDQMSGGRFQLGVGRGVSPFETAAYGLDFAKTGECITRRSRCCSRASPSDELTFEGKYLSVPTSVPMILRPVQQPHPPLWYGATLPEQCRLAGGERRQHRDASACAPTVRVITDRYRAERARLGKKPQDIPLHRGRPPRRGGRHRRGGARDRAPRLSALARRASAGCSSATAPSRASSALYPPTFDELMALDNGIAGSPRHGAAISSPPRSRRPAPTTCCSWFAFGDMTLAESLRSVELFSREVMPAFAASRAAAE